MRFPPLHSRLNSRSSFLFLPSQSTTLRPSPISHSHIEKPNYTSKSRTFMAVSSSDSLSPSPAIQLSSSSFTLLFPSLALSCWPSWEVVCGDDESGLPLAGGLKIGVVSRDCVTPLITGVVCMLGRPLVGLATSLMSLGSFSRVLWLDFSFLLSPFILSSSRDFCLSNSWISHSKPCRDLQ